MTQSKPSQQTVYEAAGGRDGLLRLAHAWHTRVFRSRALEDAGLARDERLRRVLHDYFAWATTTTMARYHDSADDVPDGLHIPKWSWDGLVSAAE